MLEENKYIHFFKKYINVFLYTLLFLGTILFIFNPFNILHYFRFSIIVLFLIVLFLSILTTCNLYIQAYYFLYYIVAIILIYITLYIIFTLFKIITNKVIIKSFSLIILYYIVLVSLIVSFSNFDVGQYSYSKINSIKNLIYFIFIYIPCFLKDTIDYFVDDYKKTNTTTIILFFILVFMLLYTIISPIIYSINSGLLLLEEKKQLNQELVHLSLKELKNGKIKESFSDIGGNESKNTMNDIKYNYSIIKTNILEYLSLRNNNLKKIIDNYKDDPEKLKNEINKELDKYFFTKLYYRFILFKNNLFTNTNAIKLSDEDIITAQLSTSLNMYHYGLSFWLFLDTNVKDSQHLKRDIILTMGDNPSLYYDYSKQLLIVEFINNYNNKIIYTTNKIIFQRWNHIVLNYVNGTFDIVVNSKIVSTAKNVVPYMNDETTLIIGNSGNSDLGGIAQVRFFDQPIDMSKIKNLYNYNNDLI